jgi:hypothetical protein
MLRAFYLFAFIVAVSVSTVIAGTSAADLEWLAAKGKEEVSRLVALSSVLLLSVPAIHI